MYGGGTSLVGSLIIMCGIDDGDVVVHLTLTADICFVVHSLNTIVLF